MQSLWGVATEVGSFWQHKLRNWWTRKAPRDELLAALPQATSFEEWEQIAFKLDEILGYDLWRQNAASKFYDYRLIYERLQAIIELREEEDVLGLVGLLRSGLVRNLGNISTPRLFNRAYAGTKLLIEDYITQVALAIEYVAAAPTSVGQDNLWTAQSKLDLLHDTRQAFGRSTLVLQGGAVFGLSHLGVVKALHLRGLLPRIITGTATGALIAALVCIHTEDELLDFLNGDGIDLTAFVRHEQTTPSSPSPENRSLIPEATPSSSSSSYYSPLTTLLRRTRRFLREGYFLDVNVLEACVRANVGDLTFEEAYARTKRVLNITISTSGRPDIPHLLNYLTSPNVLIWSAALASNTSSTTLYRPVTIYCKNEAGAIVPWDTAQGVTLHSYREVLPPSSSSTSMTPGGLGFDDDARAHPLSRIAELFNVNHFIISQARPYVAPFLRPPTSHTGPAPPTFSALVPTALLQPLTHLLSSEIQHRLAQLDALGVLPPSARRLLLDEPIPGAHLTLVPDITLGDLWRVLETPTKEGLEYWILRGERSVWPSVGELRVRCAVEVELDRGYQVVRRRKPLDGEASSLRPRPNSQVSRGSGESGEINRYQ